MKERKSKAASILSCTGLLVLLLFGVASDVHAQYGGDPNRTYTDKMVLDNINRRRLEERLKARSGTRKGVKSRKASAKGKEPAARPLGTLVCSQDMYSQFGREDAQGYTLQVTLTPTGKTTNPPLVRWFRLNGSKGETTARFERVLPGQYRMKARAILPDKTQKAVLLGTEVGSPTEPTGGDFASSTVVVLRKGKDRYGKPTVQGPSSLWFRPVEK